MEIAGKVAVITGAASGIGRAVAVDLAQRKVRALALVDVGQNIEQVASEVNAEAGRKVAHPYQGDTTDEVFRASVFDSISSEFDTVTMCVPAAGITRDDLAVRVDRETGKARIYPVERFKQVIDVNLVAPVYWALEMIGRIAENRAPAASSDSAHPRERGRIHRSALGTAFRSPTPAPGGPARGAATIMKEAVYYGVRCGVIHPGFTDTPMVRAMGDEYISKNILPFTQLSRLIRPDEIADAICFMLANSAVSGELWADAGWHAPA
jgi:NAD(P)-dependent dehydrogenase (short-subunit alcohol dehydrogenase family)